MTAQGDAGLDLDAYCMPSADLALLEARHAQSGEFSESPDSSGLPDSPDLPALRTALAWHLRQRDTRRAIALADSLDATSKLPPGLQARLQLLRAEAAWLRSDLSAAQAHALAAQSQMQALGCAHGLADAALLRAALAFESGEPARGLDELQRAKDAAGGPGAEPDRERQAVAAAMAVYWQISGALDADDATGSQAFSDWRALARPAVTMWCFDIEAQLHYRRGRYVQAIRAFEEAYQHALEAGQVRRAIMACLNIGNAYLTLNDYDSALASVETGQALSQPAGWPGMQGSCLLLLGRVLTQLGRLDAARQALADAQSAVQPMASSRTGLVAQFYDGELAQRRGDLAAAASQLASVVEKAQAAGMVDLAQMARLSLARTQSGLQMPAVAIATARQALKHATQEEGTASQLDALQLLAELHAAGPPDGPQCDEDDPLQLLHRALALAEATPGFALAPGLLDSIGSEHARRGDAALAYAMALRAGQARERLRGQQASQRAMALAARLDIERTRSERERLREEAAWAARQASLLLEANAMLEQLGRVGQEIAAGLDIGTVFARIHHHLRALLDAPQLTVWLFDDATQTLHRRFDSAPGDAAAAGMAVPEPAVLCQREGRELLVAPQPESGGSAALPPGMQTALFGPLRTHDRVVGVMAVQSRRVQAYGERQRLIFRALCAYSAVAFANAAVYQALAQAREEVQAAGEREARARRQAERAAQLKGEFLATVSQSLQRPLATLHRSLQHAQQLDAEQGGAGALASLAQALRHSEGVNVQARELLALARMESHAVQPQLETFALAELAHDVLHQRAALARQRQQQVRADFADRAFEVKADIAMVEEMLAGLLDHAMQRSPPGSDIVLRLTSDVHGTAVEVADRGPALNDTGVAELFLRPADGQRSLRLPLVREMLRLHGRDIRGHARPGGGMVLGFTLPGMLD